MKFLCPLSSQRIYLMKRIQSVGNLIKQIGIVGTIFLLFQMWKSKSVCRILLNWDWTLVLLLIFLKKLSVPFWKPVSLIQRWRIEKRCYVNGSTLSLRWQLKENKPPCLCGILYFHLSCLHGIFCEIKDFKIIKSNIRRSIYHSISLLV